MAAGVKTGGRKKGTPNKSTAQIRQAAQKHGEAAISALVKLMNSAESEAARVSAIKEILDRGYGKAPQPIDGDGEGGAVKIDNTLTIQFVRPSLKEG
jgi:hypothetical protein